MLAGLDFCGDVYRRELLFPVTKNLLQDSRKQRTYYSLCLHYCLINIHIFDYPDSRLSRQRGPTVHFIHKWLPCDNKKDCIKMSHYV